MDKLTRQARSPGMTIGLELDVDRGSNVDSAGNREKKVVLRSIV